MFNRRRFISGTICAATALISFQGRGEAQASPKIPLKILKKTEYPGNDYICVLVEVDLVNPGERIPRHMHSGVESSYLVSGSIIVSIKGQPDLIVKAGDGYQISPETPHSVLNGPDKSIIVSTLIVEKQKPLVTLVPE